MLLQPVTTTYANQKEWFASEHLQMLPEGVTIDYTTVPTAGDGSRLVESGAALGKITASGKYGPYDDSASDGREVAKGLAVVDEGSMDVVSADNGCGLLIHGFVYAARLPADPDANGKADMKQITFL